MKWTSVTGVYEEGGKMSRWRLRIGGGVGDNSRFVCRGWGVGGWRLPVQSAE